MNKLCYPFVIACLVVVLGLVSCWGAQRTSPLLSAGSPFPRPVNATSIATPTQQLETATPFTRRIEVRLERIDKRSNVVGMRWSEDGQSVLYATARKGDTEESWVEEWWRYDISRGEVQSTNPPFEIDPNLWAQLAARHSPPPGSWFWGTISPSGTRVVYNRLPLGYNYTPAPNEFHLPPYEIWVARSDGSDAVTLGKCWQVGQVVWFDDESKIIYSCGYEGAPEIHIASVDGAFSNWLNDVTAFEGLLGGWMALSPDEMKLALTDEVGLLQIVPLDGSPIQCVAQWGIASAWSSDGRMLYYLQGEDAVFEQSALYVYDVETRRSTKLFSSPLYAADGVSVKIPSPPALMVSPLGDRAVFYESRGLWLASWSAQ